MDEEVEKQNTSYIQCKPSINQSNNMSSMGEMMTGKGRSFVGTPNKLGGHTGYLSSDNLVGQ